MRGVLLVLTVSMIMLAGCGGDDDAEEPEEEAVAVIAPGTPTAATWDAPSAAPAPPPPAVAPTTRSDSGLPSIMTQADVIFTDLATGKRAFEVEVEAQFGEKPKGSIEPIDEGRDLGASVRGNLKRLAQQGYTEIEVYAVEGTGTLYLPSRVLEPLRHEGFDYNSQYNGDPTDGDLRMDEDEAKQRFHNVGDVLPMIINEAHALGIKVTVLVESLAHIINRAAGAGIGGSGLSLSGDLPPPTVPQVLGFIDEVIAAGADAISAEAFSDEYDNAIAGHLESKGVPYAHTGADLGTVWTGYYYSFYPDKADVGKVYSYLHSDCALLGTTNGTIFARARAVSPSPQTTVVVGSYNPIPCDTTISLGDVYSARNDPPVDENVPTLSDGTVVENCATGPWRNLLLVAARRQRVDRILLTADMPASVAATSRATVGQEILERIASHRIRRRMYRSP